MVVGRQPARVYETVGELSKAGEVWEDYDADLDLNRAIFFLPRPWCGA